MPKGFARTQSQPSIHSLSRGKGVWGFGKDAEIERPKAYARTHTSGRTKSVQDAPTTNDHDCRDAKPTKRSYRDREFALSYKKQTFSTS